LVDSEQIMYRSCREALFVVEISEYDELMIPREKSAAVWRALEEAFGTRSIEDIRSITRGLSSDLVLRIVVRGSPYLLRIMTRMNERNDPPRVFACMKLAAEAGLAPRVLYSNEAEGVAITDWIETVPFPTAQALVYLPATLRGIHLLPPFPKTFNYVTAHKFFIWRLRTASLLREAEIKEVFRGYERICAAYPRLDADLVSCHLNLKPENILFEGRRVWLIDWIAAFLNDRYFDLAIVANLVVANEADERTYLAVYFGQPPYEYQRAHVSGDAHVVRRSLPAAWFGGQTASKRRESALVPRFSRADLGG